MTVAEVIAELLRLPGHLPVELSVQMTDAEGETYAASVDACGVKWQGRRVEIEFE